MFYRLRVAEIPDGSKPKVGLAVAARRVDNGTTLATGVTDTDGFVTFQADGHWPPWYAHITNVPGGDKFWSSTESHTVGVFSPKELPVALRILGDGVIRNWGSELAAALVSGGPSFTVADGAATVAGTPFAQYTSSTLFSNTRPASGTRIDRLVIRLYPEGSAVTPGKSDLALLQGTPDAGVPALTQTATVHEVGLYQLAVPSAGAITLTDERVYAGEMPPVTGEARSDAVTTTNASGEALAGLSIPLTLPRNATYDVVARLNAVQDNAIGWVLQATYGSFGSGTSPNLSSPAQVAINSAGDVNIVDTGNHRVVKIDSSGTYVTSTTAPYATGVTGVCVDATNNVYACRAGNTVSKYNSDLVHQYSMSIGIGPSLKNIATDGTHLYVTDTANNKVWKRLASDGTAVTSWGGAGSGDGQFNTPWGIVYGGSEVYVVDQGNSRVQVFTTAGTFQRKWTIDSGARGIALDDSGDVWVAVNGSNALKRYSNTGTFQDSISQATPDGIDVATGDVLWVSNNGGHNIARWDEAASGYGSLAIDIGGSVSSYVGPGDRFVATGNVAFGTATGPGTVTIRAFGKASVGTATFRAVVLSAIATPRA